MGSDDRSWFGGTHSAFRKKGFRMTASGRIATIVMMGRHGEEDDLQARRPAKMSPA